MKTAKFWPPLQGALQGPFVSQGMSQFCLYAEAKVGAKSVRSVDIVGDLFFLSFDIKETQDAVLWLLTPNWQQKVNLETFMIMGVMLTNTSGLGLGQLFAIVSLLVSSPSPFETYPQGIYASSVQD